MPFFCYFYISISFALEDKNTSATTDSQSSTGLADLTAIEKLRANRSLQPDAKLLSHEILKGNIASLSRAITLVESTNPKHLQIAHDIINCCLPSSGNSVRIGITGVPGVGKSTFIESFGRYLTGLGKRVAVLAIDPSSTLSHGSILGDKTRMEELVRDPNAYIRPSASGETLGGVARKTRESVILCEAAGYDVIIIETVGVGQSETAVHSMTDFFLLLKLTGAGDELQGIKRGIMEMADAIVINKADGDNIKRARAARTEFNRALHMFPPKDSGWTPVVSTCSAITKDGIDKVWETMEKYLQLTRANGFFHHRRQQQAQAWMTETINEQLQSHFYQNSGIKIKLEELRQAVGEQNTSPFSAAQQLLKIYFKE
jgi:LAO/AO transport system kinase